MGKSLRKSGTKVRLFDRAATLQVVSETHVAIAFDDNESEPILLTNEDAEKQFGVTLFFVSAMKSSKGRTLNVAQKIEHLRRMVYLRELWKLTGKGGVGGHKKRKEAISNAQDILNDGNPISIGTLGEWARLENEKLEGCASTIPSGKRAPSPGMYDGEIRDIALEIVDEHYLVPNPPTVQSVFNDFITFAMEVLNKTLDELPSRETFRKWIYEICPELSIKKQFGRSEAKRMLRNAVGHFITSRPLERVEGDGVILQIGVVDEDGRYLGTLLFIIFIDCFTRMVLGYEMQVGKGEASSTIISAIRHAICPKDKGTFNPECKSDWPIYGCVEEFFVDGGAGFSSLETTGFAVSTGATYTILESYSAWLKPFIERLNGTIRQKFAKKIFSYVGTQDDQKLTDDSAEYLAVLTPDEVRDLFELWVVDEYHHTTHSGLYGLTPYQKYQEYKKQQQNLDDGWEPELPVNIDDLKLPRGEIRHARVLGDDCEGGVVINKIQYNDYDGKIKRLGLKHKALGEEPSIKCLHSVTDIHSITICDEFMGSKFEVTTKDPRVTPGMSKAEFDAKYPKAYPKKGFTGKSVLTPNKKLQEANAKVREKQNKRKGKKQRKASPEEIAAEAQKHLNQQGNDTSGVDTNTSSPFPNVNPDDIDKADDV
jgi:hypothetical protein